MRRLAAALVFWILAGAGMLAAQEKPLRGVALVIGQSEYSSLAALPNPVNDARSLDRLLSDLGFEVDVVTNADQRKLSRALERFVEDAEGADVALLYYSGHGIEAGGENYLAPVDASVSSLESPTERLVPVSQLMADLQAEAPVTIVLLDACRSNPFPPGATLIKEGKAVPVVDIGLGAPRGAAPLAGTGTANSGFGALLGFAAAPGQAALDGDPGANSPYAAALLKHLAASGFSFADVMTMVTEEVYLKTDARQVPWTNTSLRRELYFGAGAGEQMDEDQRSIVGERRKLLLAISSVADAQKKQVLTAAKQTDVPMDALFAMLNAIGAEIPEDPMNLSSLLEEQAQRVKALIQERQILVGADPEIERLAGLAAAAVREGALETAIRVHQKAKARVAALEGALDDAESALKARRLEYAAVFAGSGETYNLTFDHLRAAADFRSAYEQVGQWDDVLAARYKLKEADALAAQGSNKGDDAAIGKAIEAYREAALRAPAATDPDQWAKSQGGIAMAMWSKGERESGVTTLAGATGVLRVALAAPELAGKTDAEAELRADLALVLMSIGTREAETTTLQEAVAETRKALAVKTRDRTPEAWARLQNHLGAALFLQGLREQSLAKVEEAEHAFRASLSVWTRQSDPLGWANAQNNLGLAIGQIGSWEPGPDRLLEAVGYLKDALEVRTRELAPLSWAETQSNLGATYHELGLRVSDQTQWFELAAGALRLAMEEITRERDPLKWAAIQDNLGMALGGIAQRRRDTAPLYEALTAFGLALQERRRDVDPLAWASTMNNLGNAHFRLGELDHDGTQYRKAIEVFTLALQERTSDRNAPGWAQTQNNIANAFAGLAEYEDGDASYRRAIEHYRQALDANIAAGNRIAVADTQFNLALTLIAVGKRGGKQEDFDAAHAALNASQDIYRAAGETSYDSYFEHYRVELTYAEASAAIARRIKELEQKP